MLQFMQGGLIIGECV